MRRYVCSFFHTHCLLRRSLRLRRFLICSLAILCLLLMASESQTWEKPGTILQQSPVQTVKTIDDGQPTPMEVETAVKMQEAPHAEEPS